MGVGGGGLTVTLTFPKTLPGCVCVGGGGGTDKIMHCTFCSLFQTLRDSMSPNAQIPPEVDVADLCLCSDDLPPKDGIIDEADENVRRAIDQWWSYVTHVGSHRKMSDETYRYVLAR